MNSRITHRFGLLYDDSFRDALRGGRAGLDLLEIIPDRFADVQSPDQVPECLTAIPTLFHCLNLSLGSDEPLDRSYLQRVSSLARVLKPLWTSDHLAVTRIDGVQLGQLSPVRFTAPALGRISAKIDQVQNELRMPFLVENIAYYFTIPGADLSENELLQNLVEKTGCGVLLDINNVAVNAANHGFDPYTYLREFPLHAVREIHIAGHRRRGNACIDSHGEPVDDIVWDLLQFVSARLESLNVILERDQDIPPLEELLRELATARDRVTAARAGRPPGVQA